MSHLEILLKAASEFSEFWFSLTPALTFCIHNKFPRDADITAPGPTLWQGWCDGVGHIPFSLAWMEGSVFLYEKWVGRTIS